MSLSFPNPSRSFDANKGRVCFWGYDSAIEVTFFVEAEALKQLCPKMDYAEAGLLQAFDSMRDQIYKIATKVYASNREHTYAYVLSGDDFK